MYWYVVLDGKILPTPYATLAQADQEIDRLKQRLGPCICEVIYK